MPTGLPTFLNRFVRYNTFSRTMSGWKLAVHFVGGPEYFTIKPLEQSAEPGSKRTKLIELGRGFEDVNNLLMWSVDTQNPEGAPLTQKISAWYKAKRKVAAMSEELQETIYHALLFKDGPEGVETQRAYLVPETASVSEVLKTHCCDLVVTHWPKIQLFTGIEASAGCSGDWKAGVTTGDAVTLERLVGPEVYPAFNNLPEVGVYHDYHTALKVLSELPASPEVREVLATQAGIVEVGDLGPGAAPGPHPFIVVEGLDATGKTTLVSCLSSELGARQMRTPPPEISHLRSFFDAQPEMVRRAYYAVGNYMVHCQVLQTCGERPVVMDRFWHSTTAYAVANETLSGGPEAIPPANHGSYSWPRDLIKPTMVVFLTVSEEVRKQRMAGRGGPATEEEVTMKKSLLFRRRLLTAYQHMRSPPCTELDASATADEVCSSVLRLLSDRGVVTR